MRRYLVTCFGLVVLAGPVCATTSLATLFGGYSAPVVTAPAPVPTTTVNTTSPYYGFSNTGTPTSSYVGTVTTISSPSTTSLSSLFGGSSGSVSSTIVSNMNPSTTAYYVPQYVSSAPTTYATSYSAPTTTATGSGGAVSLASLFSGSSMRTPVTQTYYKPPTVTGPQVNLMMNPEPGTIALMVGGLGAVVALRLRSKRRARV